MKDAPRDPEHIEYETRIAQAMAEILHIIKNYELYTEEFTTFVADERWENALFIAVLPLSSPGKTLDERLVDMVHSTSPLPDPLDAPVGLRKGH